MEIFIVIWLMAVGVKAVVEELTTGRSRPAGPAGGGPRLPKYGVFDRMADSYRDSMRRSTDNMIARRDARDAARRAGAAPPPTRWQRAEDRLAERWEQRRRTQQPAPPPPPPRPLFPDPTGPATAPTPPPPDVTVATDPTPVKVRPRPPDPVSAPPAPEPETPEPTPDPTPAEQPAQPDTTASTGEPMGQPSGEVVNHETHIAQIDQQIDQIKKGIDLTQAALVASREARARVDEVQAIYGPVATSAQAHTDHLAALNLDSTTQGHAAEAADALTPGKVDGYYDAAEAIEKGLEALLKALEQALASKEAERAEAVKRYADAQDTVNSNLGGDSTYLNNGGSATATTTQAQPQPEPAGAR